MASSDDESAEQQLFAEFQASAKKAQQSRVDSAVQNTLLLNAARADRRRTVDLPLLSSSTSRISYTPPRSSPAGMARKGGAGKLKPVSFLREDIARQPRQNLAPRGDPFDFQPSSPEKMPVKPPKKTRKRVQHTVSQNGEEPQSPVDVSAFNGTVNESTSVPSPALALIKNQHDLEEVGTTETNRLKRKVPNKQRGGRRPLKSIRIEEADVEGEAIASAVTAKSPSRSPWLERTHPQVVIPMREPSKRNTRARARYLERASSLLVDEASSTLRSPGIDHEGFSRADHQWNDEEEVEVNVTDQTHELQKYQEQEPHTGRSHREDLQTRREQEHEQGQEHEHEPESAHEVSKQPQPRKGKRERASKKPERQTTTSNQENDAYETSTSPRQTRSKIRNERPAPTLPSKLVPSKGAQSRKSPSSKIAHKKPDAIEQPEQSFDQDGGAGDLCNDAMNINKLQLSFERNERQPTMEDYNTAEDASVIEDHDNDEDAHAIEQLDDARLSDIDKIFNFLNGERRGGNCQSDDAATIAQACQAGRRLIMHTNISLEKVCKATNKIIRLLSRYGAGSGEEYLKQLKLDAYAYLFRVVVRYLKTLYDWLEEQYRDVESSLDAMKVIAPFVQGVVSFKDQITSWKVKLPARYKHDRLVKDVETQVIVPLRRVDDAYRAISSRLKEAVQKKLAHEEASRKIRENVEAERQERDDEALRIKRMNRWIDLHVCRLQVEPDLVLRRSLGLRQDYFDSKTGSIEERDANGVAFERVDVFKKRLSPPAFTNSLDVNKDWTDEEMSALIEGLSQFAGPYVFHEIFKEYCRPNGPLRRFGVPEITAQAADIRLRTLKKFQEQDWEVPIWINRIPVLP
ncbi:hypothetical protein N0V90_004556 [Kalmusia sp. IMI 367209]|nr:hypothetical protein N0V90_004556 [Kalmusia sp. IMI 367209]